MQESHRETIGSADQPTRSLADCVGVQAIDAVLRAEAERVLIRDPHIPVGGPDPGALLPGSFNPLHQGHVGLARAASGILGLPVHFELSVINVEKPPLDRAEILNRLRTFSPEHAVWLTRQPRFMEKARVFPGWVFVVGADTAARIIDGRFYPGGLQDMSQALAAIRARKNRFLVAGRRMGDRLLLLEDLSIPEEYRDLFQEIPANVFQMDVSSTDIRRSQAHKSG